MQWPYMDPAWLMEMESPMHCFVKLTKVILQIKPCSAAQRLVGEGVNLSQKSHKNIGSLESQNLINKGIVLSNLSTARQQLHISVRECQGHAVPCSAPAWEMPVAQKSQFSSTPHCDIALFV